MCQATLKQPCRVFHIRVHTCICTHVYICTCGIPMFQYEKTSFFYKSISPILLQFLLLSFFGLCVGGAGQSGMRMKWGILFTVPQCLPVWTCKVGCCVCSTWCVLRKQCETIMCIWYAWSYRLKLPRRKETVSNCTLSIKRWTRYVSIAAKK